jgi:hypothetical protein
MRVPAGYRAIAQRVVARLVEVSALGNDGLGSLIAFLEEGQNDDWFTSVFIQRCFALAVIFIPLFIICELVSKSPVVNLRLLRIRNLGLASAVNFLLGASLYGSVFFCRNILSRSKITAPDKPAKPWY